jgi:hypothetical protein
MEKRSLNDACTKQAAAALTIDLHSGDARFESWL